MTDQTVPLLLGEPRVLDTTGARLGEKTGEGVIKGQGSSDWRRERPEGRSDGLLASRVWRLSVVPGEVTQVSQVTQEQGQLGLTKAQ